MSSVTRRSLLYGGSSVFARAQKLTPVAAAVDHLLLGVSDLQHGMDWVQQRTGVRAAEGGAHPGVGTRNALLSLGSGHYLEIIAPDPSQSVFKFQIDFRQFAEPRLITFAVTTSDIDAKASIARQAGYRIIGPAAGSRLLPSGTTLRWRTLRVENKLGSGGIEPVPFFIQWDPGVTHPSKTAPAGCDLQSLEFQHPSPSDLVAAFKTFGLEANVSKAGSTRIIAALKTPAGRMQLT